MVRIRMTEYRVFDNGSLIGCYENESDAYSAYNLAINKAIRSGRKVDVTIDIYKGGCWEDELIGYYEPKL